MRHRFIWSAAVAGGLSVAVAAALAQVAVAAPATPRPSPAVRAVSLTTAAGRPTRTALLINGDKITVAGGAAGGQVGVVTPAGSALASTLVMLRSGGTSYVVPVDALPYLGRGLDPGLFDVTRLLSAERNGRLPLRVSYQGRLPVLAGLRLTRHGGGIADGYLTAGSARAFGAALARQYLAARGHGGYAGHSAGGLLGRGMSVSLAGVSPARAIRPRSVMHTVTVTGTDLANRPDTGDTVFLLNVDDSSITGYPVPTSSVFYHGSAKFSVPGGHYLALATFLDLSARGALAGERIVTVPQFTVSGNATVRLRERAASSKVTIVTPRPAVTEATELEMTRVPRTGRSMTFGFFDAAPVATWVSPATRPVTAGSLQTFLDAWLTASARTARPYEYDLAFPGPAGVIPAGHHVVRPASLATVRARFYSPVPRRAFLGRLGYSEFQVEHALPPDIQSVNHLVPATPLRLPQVRTEYTTASRSLAWGSTLFLPGGQSTGALIQYDYAPRFYRPGEQVSEDWNGGPLHPGVNASWAGPSFGNLLWSVPSASRAGDVLTLDITPFSDSTPGHLGYGYGASPPGTVVRGTYEIDQDGMRLGGGNAAVGGAGPFIASGPLSPAPSTVTLKLSASRTGAAYPLSTRTQTTWTWRSAHQSGGSLPGKWRCPAGNRDCGVEPMLTLAYHVAGLALDDSARPGPQILGLTVGHLQLARAARITSTTVQVSFDDGTAWRAATVTGANGRYRASYRAPATARYVTLRVTAGDAVGGQITETITRAYKIAP